MPLSPSPQYSYDRRRTLHCLLLLLLCIVAGLFWRMAPLGLPWFFFKYGGSMLWAAAVYWLIAALRPHDSAARIALLAGLVSLAVEFSRLVHTPGFDAFRLTLAGKLLLGRVFSLRNVVAYWLAIAVCALLDRRRGRT